jgi:transposase
MSTSKIERVDDIPLIFHWLMKMRVAELIDRIWPTHGNWKGLSYGQLAVLFITYVVHSLNHRLSGMEAWLVSHQRLLEQLTGWSLERTEVTADRLGILLSELGSDAERIATYQAEQGQYLIRAYELPTEVARYDTTSFNVYHAPEGAEPGGLLAVGHSKDKRPDLLQFKQGLGTLDPAGVPIFTETVNGNKADDPLYIGAWRTMGQTLGRKDFLRVADGKAAAIETRATIAQEGGRYLFAIPLTGKTPEEVAAWIRQPPAAPRDLMLEAAVGAEAGSKGKRIGKGFEVEKTLTVERDKQTYQWKERWLVIRSDNHAKRQKKKLIKRVETAEKELKQLYPKATEGAEELAARANKLIENHGVSDFLSVAISERISYRKRYLKRGRPGPTSPYERQAIHEYQCRSQRHEEAIKVQCDLLGWRIYVTNTPAERMSLEQSLKYYRDEWTVERGFHRFKQGCLPVLPLFIRLPERIKGLMVLLFIALQVVTLMEFVVRRELAENQEKLAGLVPGNPKMATARPTAERLLSQFKELHLLIEYKGSEITGRLVERLTPLQEKILTLLKVPQELYNLSFSKPMVNLDTEFSAAA